MTLQQSHASFELVMTAAGQLLAQCVGVPVQLTTVVCISEEERRNRLLRYGRESVC
ncbi:MAG: hypothetical protein R3E79_59335 [Caldilineaceae bacterium]